MSARILQPRAQLAQGDWKLSKRGDPYLIRAGVTVAVYPRPGGGFGWHATAWDHRADHVESPDLFLDVESAKHAALKALPEAKRISRTLGDAP